MIVESVTSKKVCNQALVVLAFILLMVSATLYISCCFCWCLLGMLFYCALLIETWHLHSLQPYLSYHELYETRVMKRKKQLKWSSTYRCILSDLSFKTKQFSFFYIFCIHHTIVTKKSQQLEKQTNKFFIAVLLRASIQCIALFLLLLSFLLLNQCDIYVW